MQIEYDQALKDPRFQSSTCQACIRKQKEKYYKYVDDNGVEYKDFSISCEGIKEDLFGDNIKAILTEEQLEEAKAILDPVYWAKKYARLPDGGPWIARWYQEEILRCSARRRVTRLGRRVGKTDMIALHILHNCYTRKGVKILVIAPYKAQTEEIIGRIKDFINSNPVLKNGLNRSVSSPYYEMTFHNGSRIRGFSSGTKSGNEGGSIRGQDADYIYLDEANFLDTKDLAAIVAILATNANVRLWASSTPTGARNHFYKWCVNTPTYKEFHHPTMVLPHWEQIRFNFEADYAGRKNEWEHEILANFGEQAVGVFQNVYVDSALTDFRYGEQVRQNGWVYSIGVDWNKHAGTEIAVVGYNPGMRIFRVVEAVNIPKQEFTQVKGMEAIIALNNKWLPEFIYADEGNGATNIELLRKYGYDMVARNVNDPACRLKDIVKTYNFSSKIEIIDPVTKRPIKKPAKPFLVENAVRRFEERTIEISSFDSLLKKQLENYIIHHYTQSNVPVYGVLDENVGDHRLDALMLALVGYKLETSFFARPTPAINIAINEEFGYTKQVAENRRESESDPYPALRYTLDSVGWEKHPLPGIVSTNKQSHAHNKLDWELDTNGKYARRYELQRKRAARRNRMKAPHRTNF